MINSDVLYLIRHKKSKTIKIGITSQWQSRAKALRVGTDTELLALLQTPDVKETEGKLHHEFKKYRLPGSEYFALSKEQTELITTQLKKELHDVTDLFILYDLVNQSQMLDVTSAINSSAIEWFRLNNERWHRSPVFDATNVIHDASNKLCDKDYLAFRKQVNDIIDKLKIVSPFGGRGEEESIATEKIWKSLIPRSQFLIDKSLFKKTIFVNGTEFWLPTDFDFNFIQCVVPDKITLQEGDVELQSSTINMTIAIVADCRAKEKIERAMYTSQKIEMFDYYLKNYGPIIQKL